MWLGASLSFVILSLLQGVLINYIENLKNHDGSNDLTRSCRCMNSTKVC